MPRLPHPGQDEGKWGDILNDYLSQAHNPNGSLKPGIITTSNLSQDIQDQLTIVAGPQGPQGPTGTPGAQGLQGATGASGAPGAQGATGPQGPTGASGASGASGAQGPVGATGPAGATTIDGIDGLAAALAAKQDIADAPDLSTYIRFVIVTTGNEPRPGPSGGVVFWMDAREDTAVQPAAMGPQDVRWIGSIAIPSVPQARTLFGTAAPWATTVSDDGGGSLKVGNRFYTTHPAGIRVLGVRLWNPPAAPNGFLTANVTAYAFAADYTGAAVINTAWNSPTATKTYTLGRTGGTWTEILFDTPITLPPLTAGAAGSDFITLAYQIAGGNYYNMASETLLPGNSAIESDAADGTFFAEGPFRRATLTLTGAEPGFEAQDWCWYGIDMIYEVL